MTSNAAGEANQVRIKHRIGSMSIAKSVKCKFEIIGWYLYDVTLETSRTKKKEKHSLPAISNCWIF